MSNDEFISFAKFLAALARTRTLIFDLDNTIYKETDFLFYSYWKIAAFLAKRYHLDVREIFCFLKDRFLRDGRKGLFNELQERYDVTDVHFVDSCLDILRNTVVTPRIHPFPYFIEYSLQTTQSRHFIITNGNITQQQNKIKSIDWGAVKGDISVTYADLSSPKPSPATYNNIVKRYRIQDAVYIGDAENDYHFARNCGIGFIEVYTQKVIE